MMKESDKQKPVLESLFEQIIWFLVVGPIEMGMRIAASYTILTVLTGSLCLLIGIDNKLTLVIVLITNCSLTPRIITKCYCDVYVPEIIKNKQTTFEEKSSLDF